MEETGKLSFADVKKIGEHLKTVLDVEEFSITFAKQVACITLDLPNDRIGSGVNKTYFLYS
jgi:hypothetical protein